MHESFSPRSATAVEGERLVSVAVERGRFCLVRVEPCVGPERRAGAIGPLYHHKDLLGELAAFTGTRCYRLGASKVSGGVLNTFRCVLSVVPQDVEPVVSGLEALLEAGDEQPLRDYLQWPPQLHAPQELAWEGRF